MNPERLRARMRERGYTGAKLAELSDVSESTIKRALGGAKLNDSTVRMLAHALDVDVNWLNEPTEPQNEPTEPIGDPIEPTNEPTDPIDEPTESEEEEMKIAIEAVAQAYRERLDEVKTHYLAQLGELKAQYLSQIADLKRDKRVLAIAAAALVIFIITFFSYDILNPNVGWFQY